MAINIQINSDKDAFILTADGLSEKISISEFRRRVSKQIPNLKFEYYYCDEDLQSTRKFKDEMSDFMVIRYKNDVALFHNGYLKQLAKTGRIEIDLSHGFMSDIESEYALEVLEKGWVNNREIYQLNNR